MADTVTIPKKEYQELKKKASEYDKGKKKPSAKLSEKLLIEGYRKTASLSMKLEKEMNPRVSALPVKEEKPTAEEKKAIRQGEKEFREGKFKGWKQIKASMK